MCGSVISIEFCLHLIKKPYFLALQFTAFPCESYELFESGSCFTCNNNNNVASGNGTSPIASANGTNKKARSVSTGSSSSSDANSVSAAASEEEDGDLGGQQHCGQLGYYSDRAKGRGSLYLLTREEEPFCGEENEPS